MTSVLLKVKQIKILIMILNLAINHHLKIMVDKAEIMKIILECTPKDLKRVNIMIKQENGVTKEVITI